MKRLLRILLILAIIFLNISCDQITKNSARKHITAQETISIIGNNFILLKVENTGAALSMGSNLPPFLKIIVLQILPILVLLFLFIYILKKSRTDRLTAIALSFIIGGGIGNIYDRILYGSVTDFMHIDVGVFKTGIFNMSDVSIVIGTVLIMTNAIFKRNNNSKNLSLWN